ncbi:MAG: hypothetical protein OER88_03075 [Planctomycetota bacterium]|nr:hypothetical protein [Planctomycetota bacterium]
MDAVGAWVEEALDRPGEYVIRVAEIRAPATIRFRHVRALMEAVADTDIERTWLYGTWVPTKESRKSRRLPAPATDWAPRSGLGIREVPHHPELGVIEDTDPEPPR